jgi:hypothetical protein
MRVAWAAVLAVGLLSWSPVVSAQATGPVVELVETGRDFQWLMPGSEGSVQLEARVGCTAEDAQMAPSKARFALKGAEGWLRGVAFSPQEPQGMVDASKCAQANYSLPLATNFVFVPELGAAEAFEARPIRVEATVSKGASPATRSYGPAAADVILRLDFMNQARAAVRSNSERAYTGSEVQFNVYLQNPSNGPVKFTFNASDLSPRPLRQLVAPSPVFVPAFTSTVGVMSSFSAPLKMQPGSPGNYLVNLTVTAAYDGQLPEGSKAQNSTIVIPLALSVSSVFGEVPGPSMPMIVLVLAGVVARRGRR